MRDEKVAVLGLPIERGAGMTYPGQTSHQELKEKGNGIKHRNIEMDAAAEHGGTPVQNFYSGRDGNQHRSDDEEDVQCPAHPDRKHVVRPHTHTKDGDGDAGTGDKLVTENRFTREHRNDLGDDAKSRQGKNVNL